MGSIPDMDLRVKVKPPSGNSGLDAYIKKNIRTTIISIVCLMVCVAVLGVLFEPQIQQATTWLAAEFGILGICVTLLIADTFISPFPPDLLLLIVAKSDLSNEWWLWIPLMGTVSAAAGNLGWLIGRTLGDLSIFKKLLGNFREKNHEFVKKYGPWSVALGALTPIPFSFTCWTAGVLRLEWHLTFFATLLRIPRFLLYYLLIHYSASVGNWFS